jgi:hypothetical protein
MQSSEDIFDKRTTWFSRGMRDRCPTELIENGFTLDRYEAEYFLAECESDAVTNSRTMLLFELFLKY